MIFHLKKAHICSLYKWLWIYCLITWVTSICSLIIYVANSSFFVNYIRTSWLQYLIFLLFAWGSSYYCNFSASNLAILQSRYHSNIINLILESSFCGDEPIYRRFADYLLPQSLPTSAERLLCGLPSAFLSSVDMREYVRIWN